MYRARIWNRPHENILMALLSAAIWVLIELLFAQGLRRNDTHEHLWGAACRFKICRACAGHVRKRSLQEWCTLRCGKNRWCTNSRLALFAISALFAGLFVWQKTPSLCIAPISAHTLTSLFALLWIVRGKCSIEEAKSDAAEDDTSDDHADVEQLLMCIPKQHTLRLPSHSRTDNAMGYR